MKESKVCEHCGIDYVGRGAKYCSIDCRNKAKVGVRRKDRQERKPCEVCGAECKRTTTRYCSTECSARSRTGVPNGRGGYKQSEETVAKRIANTDQSKKEARRKQTMLEKYGVDNPTKLDFVTDKISEKLKGQPRPRVEGQQEAIIDSKRRNGTLNHSEETKQKIKEAVRERLTDPNFDRSVFVNSGSNGKNSKTGYYNGLYFRSSYEEMFIRFCEHYDIKLESAANKNHCIKYLASDNEVRSYYPDFYLPESNTTVEIKPISMYEVGENQNKFMAALDSVQNYVILSELDGFICEKEWEDFWESDVKYWGAVN